MALSERSSVFSLHVVPSPNTGQFLRLIVGFRLAVEAGSTDSSDRPMRHVSTLRDHPIYLQHEFRHHDAHYWDPSASLGPIAVATKSSPFDSIRHGGLRHRGGDPDQDLLPGPGPYFLRLPELVLP